MGLNMLKSMFEIHEMARTKIIEQCKFRILSAKPHQSSPVLRLLGCLIRSHPFPMLEYIAHLKELLDYFAFMNDKISTGLISCILPLTKFSRDLKDYIILVARKAMFKREDTVRIATTNAIVELIITESKYRNNEANPFQDSSSQPSCSQQPETHLELGRSLFQELSGLLRRCLSQQAKVKQVFYEGLVRIVASDPVIADNVLDFLWPHFLNYYTEDTACPLKIDSCFKVENDKLCIVEPLHCLLSCISNILQLRQTNKGERPRDAHWKCFGFAASQDNEVGRASSSDLFMKALSNIQKYLKSLTEDQPGQSQEDSSLSSPSEMVQGHNIVMLGIIEVFVDLVASKLENAAVEFKETIENEVMELVEVHGCFERKTSKRREKKRRRGDSSDPIDKHTNETKENSNASLLKLHEKRGKFMDSNLYELAVMCVKHFSVDNFDKCSQHPSQTKLNQSSSLTSFVLKACREVFKSLTAKASMDTMGNMKVTLHENVRRLLQPIMQLIWCLLLDLKQENSGIKRKMTQGKKNIENKRDQLYLALTCLKELLKPSVSEAHSSNVIEVLISLAPPNIDDMMDADQLLDMNDGDVVTELILGISRKLNPEQRRLLGHWAVGLCTNETMQSPSTAREVVKLAVHLKPAPDDMMLVSDMTTELKKLITSGDDGTRDSRDAFPIINCKTKDSLAAAFLQMVESCLIELEWGLGKLKAMLTLGYESANIEDQPGEERILKEALYSRSTLVVHVLSSFAHMSLKDTQAEQFLKLTAKFYKLLTRMAKSQIAPKGYKQSIPSLKFQKLAEVTCRRLTVPLYDFISSVQESQQTSKKGILAKIRRESKSIPELIFRIEEYEKYLIQLSKHTKVNLLRHAKRSVARDFLIKRKEKSGEQQEEDCVRTNDKSSQNEPDKDVEGSNAPVEAHADETIRPSAQCGNPVQDSESDGEDEAISGRSKRAKTNQIVQDSDEEAEDE
ncbi:hypothetical protein ACP70R_012409 [Stipagrostis hirtigluma subsp. patula]